MPEEQSTNLVTIFDPNDENFKNLRQKEIISLKHPSMQEDSDFLLLNTTTSDQHHIYEVQALETKYGSYFIGSNVISNGSLHVATRVDPLFFALEALSSSANQKWQPLEQLEIPEAVQKSMTSTKNYLHICAVNDQLGDDMLLYKLNDEKILKWLTKKQERALKVMEADEEHAPTSSTAAAPSSTSAGFNLVETNVSTAPTTSASTISDAATTRMYHCSIQVVCDYLSPAWQSKFIQHLEVAESNVLQPEEKKATNKRTWDEVETYDVNVVSAEKKKKPVAQSVGLKKLQKVSTKGMKSLSSFFGAKKKKKA